MPDFRYLRNVSTLALDPEACVGCGACARVCPQGVLELREGRAQVLDRDACMECGACALNCPAGALAVNPGVGCAALILQTWLHKLGLRKARACCS
jgi:NAD-dependent dihydropyrimidine dehydrogenase PreA subunit